MHQKDKSSESKVKFRLASNRCKRVLEAPNLYTIIKQKRPPLPRNLALETFGELPIAFSTKGKSAMPPVLNDLEVLPSASDSAKLFAENVSKNSNLDDSLILRYLSLYLFSLLELICNSQDGTKGHIEP